MMTTAHFNYEMKEVTERMNKAFHDAFRVNGDRVAGIQALIAGQTEMRDLLNRLKVENPEFALGFDTDEKIKWCEDELVRLDKLMKFEKGEIAEMPEMKLPSMPKGEQPTPEEQYQDALREPVNEIFENLKPDYETDFVLISPALVREGAWIVDYALRSKETGDYAVGTIELGENAGFINNNPQAMLIIALMGADALNQMRPPESLFDREAFWARDAIVELAGPHFKEVFDANDQLEFYRELTAKFPTDAMKAKLKEFETAWDNRERLHNSEAEGSA